MNVISKTNQNSSSQYLESLYDMDPDFALYVVSFMHEHIYGSWYCTIRCVIMHEQAYGSWICTRCCVIHAWTGNVKVFPLVYETSLQCTPFINIQCLITYEATFYRVPFVHWSLDYRNTFINVKLFRYLSLTGIKTNRLNGYESSEIVFSILLHNLYENVFHI